MEILIGLLSFLFVTSLFSIIFVLMRKRRNRNERDGHFQQEKLCQLDNHHKPMAFSNDVKVPSVMPVVENDEVKPLSVNYHFTRQCNYTCGFCFHTAKTSFVLPLEDAKRGLKMLKDAGMEKINFSGGEPFIVKRGSHLGEMVRYCKETLQLPSVSIISNGSLIQENWFVKYGEYLDILAVSCDSFDPDTNERIGRQNGRKNHLNSLWKVRQLCYDYKVAFKLNTVVNTCNIDEDMGEQILQLDPCRWKVFQCLVIGGENAGNDALRNAESFVVTDDEFQAFLDRHKDVKCLVPESNEKMQNSYLILDEYMRFLDCTKGGKEPSRSVLDVGVKNALSFSGFDEKMFFKRGGKYTWSKGDMKLDWSILSDPGQFHCDFKYSMDPQSLFSQLYTSVTNSFIADRFLFSIVLYIIQPILTVKMRDWGV